MTSETRISRRIFTGIAARLAAFSALGVMPAARALSQTAPTAAQPAPLRRAVARLYHFATAPFPYHGNEPDDGGKFLDTTVNGRRGHTAPRGGVYFEDTTYSDNRTLLAFPAGFDLNKPAALVVFFHGNQATLERDVLGGQRVFEQLRNSGINAALIAPQFAVDALDSSAGHFWEPQMFALFMSEAATNLASLWGSQAARDSFAHMPIIMVAYSGGYDPAAYALTVGGVGRRVRGVILLDALFGEPDRFADWIAANHRSAFFFSAYGDAAPDNMAVRHQLDAKDISYSTNLPKSLRPGQVTFFSTPGIPHVDYMTQAWVKDPLTWALSRVAGFSR